MKGEIESLGLVRRRRPDHNDPARIPPEEYEHLYAEADRILKADEERVNLVHRQNNHNAYLEDTFNALPDEDKEEMDHEWLQQVRQRVVDNDPVGLQMYQRLRSRPKNAVDPQKAVAQNQTLVNIMMKETSDEEMMKAQERSLANVRNISIDERESSGNSTGAPEDTQG